jgi:hypothetical protein
MDILGKIIHVLTRRSYPETQFGMEPIEFFLALLRICPEGSRLTFDQSEPASFVIAFREWSHRADINTFEADYYTIDQGFISLIERLVAEGHLELYCHFAIGSPRGGLLCSSWDDLRAVKLAPEIEEQLRKSRLQQLAEAA